MNLQSLARNARLYARAEGLVAEIRLRLLARKLVLSVLAVAVALFGLVFVNMALFNYLESAWVPRGRRWHSVSSISPSPSRCC
jgi:hypothetical protein